MAQIKCRYMQAKKLSARHTHWRDTLPDSSSGPLSKQMFIFYMFSLRFVTRRMCWVCQQSTCAFVQKCIFCLCLHHIKCTLLWIKYTSFLYWCYDHRNRNRFLTENWIESKSYFLCIPSNDLSIEALDGLLTPSRFNRQTRDHTLQRGRSSVFKLFICRRRPPAGLEWERGEGGGRVLFLDKQGPRTDSTDIGR